MNLHFLLYFINIMSRIEMKERLICKECSKEFTKIDCVTRHVKIVHKIEPKEYYDKWFKTATEGKCKCCGAETKYWSLEHGYREFCSRKCFWKVTTQLESVKEKRKQTCKEKYNSENYMQCKDFKEKSETTCMQKYNTKNGGGSKDAVEKIKATKFKNHGDENFNNSKPKELATIKKFSNLCKDVIILSYSDKLFTCKCKNCNKEFKIPYQTLYNRLFTFKTAICTICNPILEYDSNEERKITDFIKSVYTGIVIENDRAILNGKELDIYLPDLNIAFEFDGTYWHADPRFYKEDEKIGDTIVADIWKKDKLKDILCESKGIKLYRIKEYDWINDNENIKNNILSMLNNIKICCKICGDVFDSYRGLSNHLGRKHDIDTHSYYDKYLKTETDGICKICNKPTAYKNLQYGYRIYCSNKCSRKDNDIYKKAQVTNIEKYGTSCSLNNQEVKNKALQTKKEKYGSEYYCNSEKSKQKIEQKTFDKFVNDIKDCDIISYKNKSLTCKCKQCGLIFTINESFAYLRHYRYNIPLCINCVPLLDLQSAKEKEINKFIKSIYTGDIIENDRTILNGKELDIYLPEKKLAFEFDGLYWHSELYKDKDYHLNKTEICKENDIQLIHIFEDEWLYKQDIVKSRIRGLLGLNERIFARKCIIKEVSYKDSEQFLNDNHIQGNCMSSYRYGLYYNNELVSLMTFGKSRFANEYELLRFCNKLNINVIGGASKLFKHFLSDHSEIIEIISFADRRWSIGNLYEKLGFKYSKTTPPSYFYIIDNIRYNRIDFQKHKLVKEGYDPNLSEHEIMLSRNIYRIYDCGNLKYVYKI